jgi:hypothetical protein
MTSSYSAYGLILASNVQLVGLPQGPDVTERADVTLSLGAEPDWVREAAHFPAYIELPVRTASPHDDPSLTFTNFGGGEFFELSYTEGARFIVDRCARRVWGAWSSSLTIEDAVTYLLGPVMGFVLRRRGIFALHASSVCVKGCAVALCGESEAGKSTTAAALSLAGFSVLTEDISPIHEDAEIFDIQPGYPRVRLWPDSVAALFGFPDALPALTPTWEKRFLHLDDHRGKFESQPQPLGAIYILARRADDSRAPYVESLTQREALLELVQNTYMNWLLDRAQRAAELDILTRIVARVPVRRITPHADPTRIKALCDLIVDDATSLLSARRPANHSA